MLPFSIYRSKLQINDLVFKIKGKKHGKAALKDTCHFIKRVIKNIIFVP